MDTSQREPEKDFDNLSAVRPSRPSGIWSNGTTIWIADWNAAKIFAYVLATKERDPERDFNTLRDAGNTGPVNLWSDGEVMWVSDFDGKIYAYNMP